MSAPPRTDSSCAPSASTKRARLTDRQSGRLRLPRPPKLNCGDALPLITAGALWPDARALVLFAGILTFLIGVCLCGQAPHYNKVAVCSALVIVGGTR